MKKLLVIGAGFLQSFVIKKAHDMGYIVFAVDADPNAVGFQHCDEYAIINIIDEKACLKYAQSKEIDGVLTAATDYGVLTASYIAEHMELPGLRYSVAKQIKNKYLVRKILFDKHVDDNEQAYAVDEETDIVALGKVLHYPVMVKPCDGSGSRGASKVNEANELQKACEYAMNGSISHRAEIESFIVGKEYGAETLVIDGEPHVLGIMKKWMTNPPYFAELGHALPNDLPKEIEDKVIKCVKSAIRVLEISTGSVNMDMLISPDGKVYIIDIGARMGGNMIGPCVISYGTGIDYMAAMIQNAIGDPVDLSVYDKSIVATRLLAFKGGVIHHLPDIAEVEKKFDVEIYHHMTEGMKVNEYHTNLDGCGYIIAKGNSVEKAVYKAEKALEYITEVALEG